MSLWFKRGLMVGCGLVTALIGASFVLYWFLMLLGDAL